MAVVRSTIYISSNKHVHHRVPGGSSGFIPTALTYVVVAGSEAGLVHGTNNTAQLVQSKPKTSK